MIKAKCTLAVAALVAMTASGLAADDPFEKPITIVVSSAVGGSVDALARQLSPHWQKTLGRPINVENHEGAGGVVGVRHFTKLAADCHNVLVGTEAHFTAAVEKAGGEVSPENVELINLQQFDPTSFSVLQTSRFKTLEDFIKEAQAKPNTITWGSPPTGSAALFAKTLVRDWKLDVRFVPQGNGAETDTALLGGHIDLKVGTAAGDVAEVQGVRVLAVASPDRLKFLPDVPTFNEVAAKMGFSKLPSLGTARFVLVPAACKEKYPERYKKLVESFAQAFNSPEYQKALKDSGQIFATSFFPPDESTARFRALVRDSIKYRKELKS